MATENEPGGAQAAPTVVGSPPQQRLIPRQAAAPDIRRGTLPGQRRAGEQVAPAPTGPLTVADVRARQLEILRTVDAFCGAHEIRWSLAFGTLLGAVRHGGYIPWDDDIDLMMPRADYERFCAAFNDSEIAGTTYAVGCGANTADWPYPFAKVHDRRTTLHEYSRHTVTLGVNIDIFPIDGCGSAVHTRGNKLLRRMHTAKYVQPRAGRSMRRRMTLALVRGTLRPFSMTRLTTWWTRWALRHPDGDSTTWAIHVGPGDWSVPSAALAPDSVVRFEDLTMPAPADVDAVLTAIYGNYLQLPPEDKRVTHHAFTAHWGACTPDGTS